MKGADRDAALVARAARRLAVQFGVVIALILAIVGLVVYTAIDSSFRESVEQQLESALDGPLPAEFAPGGPVAVVSDGVIRTPDDLPDGLPDLAALERVLQGEKRATTTVQHEDHQYLVLTERDDGVVVQAAIDRHEGAEERDRITGALAAGGIVGALAAALGAYFLARRAMRPLAAALQKQRRFVADASHELRTPLTLLSTRVQLLRRKLTAETDPAAIATEVGAIERDTHSLTRLLEDLLAAADDRPVTTEPVDIAQLARDAISAAQAHAERSGIYLEIQPDSAARAQATPQGVRQILTALVSNAVDHARTRVTLAVLPGRGTVTLRVADDGEGFPPGTDVFGRFASHRTGADSSHHYGLGLALVAEIAHRFGGSVRVREDLPGGVIEVILPGA